MKPCRGFEFFMTSLGMTLLGRPVLRCLAAGLLLAPAELSSQWLTYRGSVSGRYSASCPDFTGKVVPRADSVSFTFYGAGDGDIVSEWYTASDIKAPRIHHAKVAEDGSASGKGVKLPYGGTIDWFGRFRLGSDGTVQASGAISPEPGEPYGCTGAWSAEKAADAAQPSQPAGPTTENAVCADYKARISRAYTEINAVYLRTTMGPTSDVAVARDELQKVNRNITGIKNGTVRGSLEEQLALRKALYARIDGLRKDIEEIVALHTEIRRLQSQAKAAGCAVEGPTDSPRTFADKAINALLELDSPQSPPDAQSPPDRMGVAEVKGQVEIQSHDGTLAPLMSGTRIGLEYLKPTTIRTGPGSSVTIQVGSVRKTLQPNTTIRIELGQPDVIEQGGATVDERKPGPDQIQTPTATVKVGGTVFSVSYDANTRTTGVMVEEGSVSVEPTNPSVRRVTLAPGEYVEVSSEAMTAVLPAPGAPETTVGSISPGRNFPEPPPGNPLNNPQGLDLTGLWLDDTGGGAVYHVRQVGNRIYWVVDGTPMRSFVNLSYGEISGTIITGIWVDLPGSPSMGGGNLSLRIESNDRFVKVSSSPNYGAQSWTRLRNSSGGVTGAGPQRLPAPPRASEIPIWQYQAAGGDEWGGTWTRRGNSDLYDSNLRSRFDRRVVIVEQVTFEGNRVHAQRIQSSDGIICTLDGTLQPDGHTYLGTGRCAGQVNDWYWRITPAGLSFPPW